MAAASPDALLRSVFGFESFRPGQAEIVSAVEAGENVLAIMPTGGGKSLCFQLPALCRDGVTVVISPLIALMRDQVRSLGAAGVAAGALTSGNTGEETEAVHQALAAGQLKLLYMAPERLAAAGITGWLRRAGVSMIAVDEAHCVSQWGHDFRPDYLRIGQLRRELDVPLAAFTATADEETREEIVTRLFDGLAPRVFLHGFDRPNLHLAFAAKAQPRRQILDFAAARRGLSGIVYCGTRAKTETLSQALREAGHSACHYHGGMEAGARRAVEERFQTEDGLIVVATVAFGMGVDKPDIRWVAHADLPKSIESYYQEIGRAGRDGAPAETLTLYGPDDIRLRRSQIDEGAAPTERKAADHVRLNALLGLAEALTCRRQALLGYFGEQRPEPCGYCDLCERPPETFDGTMAVRKALSAILRTGESFGTGHLIDILLGADTDKIRARGHDKLPTYGVGREYDRTQWQAIFRQMMGHDLVRPDPERHGGLRMTDAARPILRDEAGIVLRRDSLARVAARPAVRMQVAEEDAPLLSALKAKRRALAEAAGVPAYVIFADRTLIEMAERRPGTLDEMAGVNGVGATKLERFGATFLEVITGEVQMLHPARRRLAANGGGEVFDRLQAVQSGLIRGADGAGRYLSCAPSTLRHIAERRPGSLDALARIPGMEAQKIERFGAAFLQVLAEAS
ncbi:DNA helicase RecQ [Tropicimonas sp. IMCC34043]|uniref:DNA helicase RecQ n=1 Tax=Tropicimonas sp. IMCC34043 TaxID=2248760 RepID=UPI000E260BE8|nr:DNA helicase RecQ [Tropicimonas sp. IMCC34043]